MKRLVIFPIFLLTGISLFAIDLVPTQELLAGYLERDSSIKKSAIALQKKQLEYSKNEIENGFEISLSTGDMTITFGEDSEISVNPSVKMKLPQYSNLGIEAGGKLTMSPSKNEFGGNGNLNFSVDLISANSEKREISALKAERSVLEAERDLSTKALEKEKEFYETLSKLLSKIKTIISKQKSYYDDRISFEKIKAQGYGKNSSSYRKAEMQVLNDEHEIETAQRDLLNSYKLFYSSCGKQLEFQNFSDFISLIPDDIQQADALDVHSFVSENYTEIEKAVWNNKIKTMERNASKNYSLAAETGYSYDFDSNNQKINAGLKGSYNGIELKLTAGIPIGGSKNPSVTLGASFNPNTLKTNKISAQEELLTEKEELMEIENARTNYENKVQAKELDLEELLWKQNSNNENLKLYQTTETEMQKWYKQGIITESEYLSAKVNRESCSVSSVINLIDMIVYNIEIKTMFVDDTQINRTVKTEVETE